MHVRDSVRIREAGDTVFIDRWHTRWRERTVHDTVVERHTDTVRETETVEKTVEVPKKGGYAGWTAAVALLAAIAIHTTIKTLLKHH